MIEFDRSTAIRFGGRLFAPEMRPVFQSLMNQDTAGWWAIKVANRVVKGWHPTDGASGDTHNTGHAADIDCRGLSDDCISDMLSELRHAGCAAAFRPRLWPLGNGATSPYDHIHFCLLGHSNSVAVAAATEKDGYSCDTKTFAWRLRHGPDNNTTPVSGHHTCHV